MSNRSKNSDNMWSKLNSYIGQTANPAAAMGSHGHTDRIPPYGPPTATYSFHGPVGISAPSTASSTLGPPNLSPPRSPSHGSLSEPPPSLSGATTQSRFRDAIGRTFLAATGLEDGSLSQHHKSGHLAHFSEAIEKADARAAAGPATFLPSGVDPASLRHLRNPAVMVDADGHMPRRPRPKTPPAFASDLSGISVGSDLPGGDAAHNGFSFAGLPPGPVGDILRHVRDRSELLAAFLADGCAARHRSVSKRRRAADRLGDGLAALGGGGGESLTAALAAVHLHYSAGVRAEEGVLEIVETLLPQMGAEAEAMRRRTVNRDAALAHADRRVKEAEAALAKIKAERRGVKKRCEAVKEEAEEIQREVARLWRGEDAMAGGREVVAVSGGENIYAKGLGGGAVGFTDGNFVGMGRLTLDGSGAPFAHYEKEGSEISKNSTTNNDGEDISSDHSVPSSLVTTSLSGQHQQQRPDPLSDREPTIDHPLAFVNHFPAPAPVPSRQKHHPLSNHPLANRRGPTATRRNSSSLVPPSNPDQLGGAFALASSRAARIRPLLDASLSARARADHAVEDAAASLLTALAGRDSVMQAARAAAEAAALASSRRAKLCLAAALQKERVALEGLLETAKAAEEALGVADIREDLATLAKVMGRGIAGGCEGGSASALAVLDCHGPKTEGSGVGATEADDKVAASEVGGSTFCGSTFVGSTSGGSGSVGREEVVGLVQVIFDAPQEDQYCNDIGKSEEDENVVLKGAVGFLTTIVSAKTVEGQSHRSSVCFALNNQRSIRTDVGRKSHFDALSRVMHDVLTGCSREEVDVASAKTIMMLAETFYFLEKTKETQDIFEQEKEDTDITISRSRSSVIDRTKRIYVRSKLIGHPIWSDESFWDQALFQCISESLAQTGILANFSKPTSTAHGGSGNRPVVKWHDLQPHQRLEAVGQLHVIVFSQLGALAHSMVEFGCGYERSAAFVRRLSIRHQLPIPQRSALLEHLSTRKKAIYEAVAEKERLILEASSSPVQDDSVLTEDIDDGSLTEENNNDKSLIGGGNNDSSFEFSL